MTKKRSDSILNAIYMVLSIVSLGLGLIVYYIEFLSTDDNLKYLYLFIMLYFPILFFWTLWTARKLIEFFNSNDYDF